MGTSTIWALGRNKVCPLNRVHPLEAHNVDIRMEKSVLLIRYTHGTSTIWALGQKECPLNRVHPWDLYNMGIGTERVSS